MKNYITPNLQFFDLVPIKAQGSSVWDEAGREYIDLFGGIAVNALGHCHPALIRALEDQAHKLWHISNLYLTLPTKELAKKLVQHSFAEQVFFANSGAEANEAALKLARKYAFEQYGPSKDKIVSCCNSFHGRTLFTVSVSGQKKYQLGFGPLPPGIQHIALNDTEALEKHLDDQTCAFICEPIQGESGVIPAESNFLKLARRLCDLHKIVFILDEVQTGMGRTGKLFAYQHYGITPDIMTLAKALGCGVPIGAMLTLEKFAKAFAPGSHGTTLGGNPLGCAVANVAFDLINSAKTLQHVQQQGLLFRQKLNQLMSETGKFQSIRGEGLLLGCVLQDRYQGKARELVQAALAAGVLISQAGPDVIRLAPSLIIQAEEREKGLARFEQALKQWNP
ncbi:MAG: acetylornithine/succinyldiaminopimelate transaminase [Neisseriaceae bacterium]